ncbi:TauD/TfdA dioxygenase family protein [Streptomyces sp. NPDC054796]
MSASQSAAAPDAGAVMTVRPLGGAFGAEVHGIDLADDGPGLHQALADVLAEHHVLCVREQSGLSPAAFLAFARRFGRVTGYPFGRSMEGFPDILRVIKEPATEVNFGGVWHTDSPYHEIPPSHTVLLGVDIPGTGGDTLVADMCAAYEALDEGTKARIDHVDGVFSAAKVHGSRSDDLRLGDVVRVSDQPRADREFHHPIVRTHPVTGRRGLYVSACHMTGLAGMAPEEAEPLIAFLTEHVVRPEFTSRIRWTPGTVVVIDNRCVQHKALNDYPGHRREIHRIQVSDDRRPVRTP